MHPHRCRRAASGQFSASTIGRAERLRNLGIRGISVAIFAILGLFASYLVSETLRSDARNVWEIEADSAAQSLTRTLLGWLEESYAPLSGLAALNENSDNLTEAEFLSAYDGLEARATAFFLEGAALYVPMPVNGGAGWRMKYSTDPDGALSRDTPLSIEPALLQSIRVAEARFGELILGRPILGPDGRSHVSPVALGTFNSDGNQVIVGLVDYAHWLKGFSAFMCRQARGYASPAAILICEARAEMNRCWCKVRKNRSIPSPRVPSAQAQNWP